MMRKINKLSKIEISEREYFDKLAEKYDQNYHYLEPFTKYKIAKKSSEFARLIKTKTKAGKLRILEVGCGTGEYTKQVGKLFPEAEITGLDISEHIVAVARRKCKEIKNISFVVRSAYNTGFPSKSFDVVFGFYVLHHLNVSKLRKETLRILKPRGLVFFYEPNLINPVVYFVKSNKYLKNWMGDSPNEWAVNPLSIGKRLIGFKIISMGTSEFILPLSIIPVRVLIALDKITSYFKYLPFINRLGGSVWLFMKKE